MGFISSSTTVTVQANLTAEGKKKLFDAIESDRSMFVSKFSLGDSDIDYRVIAEGNPILSGGSVPEASTFRPRMKSYALASGKYFPAIPLLLVDGATGPIFNNSFPLIYGDGTFTTRNITLSTQWGTDVVESYRMEINYPNSVMTEEIFNRILSVRLVDSTLTISQISGMNLNDLAALATALQTGEAVFSIRVVGQSSHAIAAINVILTV